MGETNPVIIDNGSLITKVGFGGFDEPELTFPTSSLSKPGTQAIRHGIIQNWDDMLSIYHKIFTTDIKQEMTETPIVLTSTSNAPIEQRVKLTEIFFETYKVPSFAIENSCMLDLFPSDQSTGLFVEIGDGVTDIAPFYEGFGVESGNVCSKLGGLSVTKYLQKIIHSKQKIFIDSIDILRDIKEKYCYAWSDQPAQPQEVNTGRVNIRLKDEFLKCSDFLFNPHCFGAEAKGIHQLIYDSINKVDPGMRSAILKNIYLGGGACAMKGFKERLNLELKKLLPTTEFEIHYQELEDEETHQMKIIKNTAWRGASIFSVLTDTFEKYAITRAEYVEGGADAAYRKHH